MKSRNFANFGLILAAIFIPPLALFLIWKYRRDWLKRHKVLVILVSIWMILWFIGFINTVVNPQKPIITKTETQISQIQFSKKTDYDYNDNSLEYGQSRVSQVGVDGENKITYEVKYQNGKEISRKQVKQETIKQPIDEITLYGTHIAPSQDLFTANPSPPSASTQTSQPQNDQSQYYCVDGTPAYGNPHARGRANSCYGHGGWQINH